jgi:hypothetical protein
MLFDKALTEAKLASSEAETATDDEMSGTLEQRTESLTAAQHLVIDARF